MTSMLPQSYALTQRFHRNQVTGIASSIPAPWLQALIGSRSCNNSMTSPRVVNRGLGAGLQRELGGETETLLNIFSTPARRVLDELFGAGSGEGKACTGGLSHHSCAEGLSVTNSVGHRWRETAEKTVGLILFIRGAQTQKLLSHTGITCNNRASRQRHRYLTFKSSTSKYNVAFGGMSRPRLGRHIPA